MNPSGARHDGLINPGGENDNADWDGIWEAETARLPNGWSVEVRIFPKSARSSSRDLLFTEAFAAMLRSRGIDCVKIPAKSPNCNPHAERPVKTVKYECLNHFVFFGERHLSYVVKEFEDHYLTKRFYQGLDGQLIKAHAGSANDNGTTDPIVCRSRLGSLLNYYHREAA